MMISHSSCGWLFETPRIIAHQAPLSIGFSRQEYWSGLPCPPPGDLPNAGNKPRSPAWQILYHLSHQESPRILEWVVYPFSSGSSRPRNWTRVSCNAGRFFTSWAARKAPFDTVTPGYSPRCQTDRFNFSWQEKYQQTTREVLTSARGVMLDTMEYHSATETSEIMTFAATSMCLEIVLLSEVRQRRRNTI